MKNVLYFFLFKIILAYKLMLLFSSAENWGLHARMWTDQQLTRVYHRHILNWLLWNVCVVGRGWGDVDSSAVSDLKKVTNFEHPVNLGGGIRVTAADPCVQHTACSHHGNQIHKGESCHFHKSWPVMQETHAFHWWCAVPSASNMGKWCHFSSITCMSLCLTSQQRLLWIRMAKETQYSAAALPMGTHTEALVLRLPVQCSLLDPQGCWPLTAKCCHFRNPHGGTGLSTAKAVQSLGPTGVLSLDCQSSGVPWTHRGAGPSLPGQCSPLDPRGCCPLAANAVQSLVPTGVLALRHAAILGFS